MELYLLRHGQSMWQTGQTPDKNSSLTALGQLQADHMNQHLLESGHIIPKKTRLISSPQRRSIQTVEGLNTQYEIDDRLQEAPFHVADFLPKFERKQLYGQIYATQVQYTEFRDTINSFLKDIISDEQDDSIALYTHGGVIKTLLRIIHDNDGICYSINNCSLTKIVWFRSRWHIQLMNDISFLPYDYVT